MSYKKILKVVKVPTPQKNDHLLMIINKIREMSW